MRPVVPSRQTVTLFAAGSVLVLAIALSGRGRGGAPGTAIPAVRSERGTLAVTLVEPGTIEAARSVTLASEIRSNRAKIVFLLDDGTWVKPGDDVVRFDPTPFEEEAARRTAELRDAEAAAVRAAQERKLQIAKAEQALESARHVEKIARLNLDAYEKGSGALNVREAEVRAAERRSELERERRNLADVEQMFSRGFVSEGEVARAREKVGELERQTELQQDRLKATRDVLFPRDLERAKTDLQEAKDGLARAEQVLYHTHEFWESAVAAADRKVETAREALRVARDELEKTTIRAPLAGFLILQDIPLDSGKRKPQVGDSVWSGQAIATIPDLSQLVVLTKVREIDLHRIAQDLRATVTVEAYPDLVLNGRVDFVGSLATAARDSPWKFFDVRLLVDRTDPRLRPGMSARVSFELDSVKGAVIAPLDAVFARGDGSVCYVRRGDEVWEQPIVPGRRNDTHVEIRSGLEPGEELLLAVPERPVRRAEPREPHA
jgi:HlyD family secretion protein